MNPPLQTLEECRRQIDALDRQMLETLRNRAEIVRRVGEIKAIAPKQRKQSIMRSGREAQILYDMMTAHRGLIPSPIIAQIWRLIICGSIHIEEEMRVCVQAGEGSAGYFLAREYFGIYTPVTTVRTAQQAMDMLQEEKVTIAVFPLEDGSNGAQSPWWRHTALADDVKVFAHMPFITGRNIPDLPSYVAVARLTPEPGVDDYSLWVIENAAMDETGMHVIARSGDFTLLSINGFVDEKNIDYNKDILLRLQNSGKYIGAYNAPIIVE